ncbi:hypothetical protein BH20CHL8_BH20CHL8_04790 [soil metagenome]
MSEELSREEQALVRSIQTAYRPYVMDQQQPVRRRALRPWIAVAATLVTVLIVVGVVMRPPSALASWTAAPTTSDPAALHPATEAACREQARTLIDVGRRAGWPEDPALEEMRRVPLVAFDQRGTASAALFADEDDVWVCVIIPVTGQPPYVELGGGTGFIAEDLGLIEVSLATAGWNSDYGGRWEIAGRVDPQVRQATIVTADGQGVIATIDDGWFLAWWPSESSPVRIDLHAAGGELLDSIDLGERFLHEPSCRLVLAVFDGICIWH